MRVAELISLVDELAPFALAEDWDNVGLLVGRADAEVTSVMVALDARPAVIAAAEAGCDAVLTHHPVIFPSVTSVSDRTTVGLILLEAARHGIAIVAAHTNLDSAVGGLNDRLAAAIGMREPRPLDAHPELPGAGLGRVGSVDPVTVGGLAASLGATLGTGTLAFTGDADRPVRTVACCTGSGGGFIDAARAAGADAYVTGDLRYHDADRADRLALVCAPHHACEDWALRRWFPDLRDRLTAAGCEATMAPVDTDPWTSGPAAL